MKLEEEDIAKSCLKEGRRLCWIIRNTNRIVDKWTGLPNSRMECITLHRAMLRSANYTENSLSPERQESATVHAASVLPHHLSRTIYHDISETMTLVVNNSRFEDSSVCTGLFVRGAFENVCLKGAL